jgi:AcrR family transcriptional regulator
MRRLGAELGVEAMALYRHVENKEEILDGIVDLVVGEIEIPVDGEDWRGAMRRRATSARAVFARHSWAIGLLEARGSRGASSLRYLDAILGNLRSAGFSVEDAAHAFWLLDSYVYGHVVQEMSLRRDPSGETAGWGEVGLEGHPHLLEAAEHAGRGGASVDREFAFGLELILDALGERLAGEDR